MFKINPPKSIHIHVYMYCMCKWIFLRRVETDQKSSH